MSEDAWLNRLADAAETEGREGAISMEEMTAEVLRSEPTVYIVFQGYRGYPSSVDDVFANEADANAYAAVHNDSPDLLGDPFFVAPIRLRTGPVDMRPFYSLSWAPEAVHFNKGEPYLSVTAEEFEPRDVRFNWNTALDPHLLVDGWDRDEVLRVGAEQRAEYLREHPDSRG
ncbi:hypothetical protein AB0I28_12750 [Phytomonospora sp. NPDC050363]|uniref:hypothetical protein n=1 Tax=Phytomonospora sp. NPDC050363 TaxID=3155642 RepID=UPI0033C21C3D